MRLTYCSSSTPISQQPADKNSQTVPTAPGRASKEYTHGYAAYFSGCPMAACPHLHADPHRSISETKATAWLSGWLDAEADARACAPLTDIGCANLDIGGCDD